MSANRRRHESVEAPDGGWPGARRRSYLFMMLLYPPLLNLCLSLPAAWYRKQLPPDLASSLLIAGWVLPLLMAVWFGLARLVNLGMSRWWFLGQFIPILNLWLGYRCFACPAGYRYHKKMDPTGIVLAIVYWLILLLGLGSLVMLGVWLMKATSNPQWGPIMTSIRERLTFYHP
jgi:hypothetical protein